MTASLPQPVPTGTDHYYQDRLDDFVRRCPEATPPSYYADYGDKCLHQFRRTEPNLTIEGQKWLQRTLVDLQARLEQRLTDDPAEFGRLERDDDAFEKMAFSMHSDAYLASGVATLPAADLWEIANTPDASDLMTPRGLKEILDVVKGIGNAESASAPRRALGKIVDVLSGVIGR